MSRAATAGELLKFRAGGQYAELYLAILNPASKFTARLNVAPTSTDMVSQINYDAGTGAVADIKIGMTIWIGSTAGAYDKGMCRVRKAPTSAGATPNITGIIYIDETSEINWLDNDYITIVGDFDLWAKHMKVTSSVTYVDVDVAYSNQHSVFDPVVNMGSHAVVWLIGATVTPYFTASTSWVFDSTIASYVWTATGASATANLTTATPTITYNTAGTYLVSCAVTTAAGKTHTGWRYVFVYTAASMPITDFTLKSCSADYSNGGWEFDVEMFANAGTSTVRDRALVILFSRDHYADDTTSIGSQQGRENIVCVGRISGETIETNTDTGQVSFSVRGWNWWMQKINAFPSGLELAPNTPSVWTSMTNLSIDRTVWHLLHWRSTASIIMDIYKSDDTRLAAEALSLSTSLWSQMTEFVSQTILGSVGVDKFGSLYVQVDPNLVPTASRAYPVIQNLTTADWEDTLSFERNTVREVSLVSLSGVSVGVGGSAAAYFSLSMGHVFSHYGRMEDVEKLLLVDQAQANNLAGLLFSFRNNEYKNISFNIPANNRLIDLYPNQYLTTTITAGQNIRGLSFSGNLIPRSVEFSHDASSLEFSVKVECEPEIFAALSVNGDIPAVTGIDTYDSTVPPIADFPVITTFPSIEPSPTVSNYNHPKKVVLASSKGVLYTSTFDSATPVWLFMNNGLSVTDVASITQLVVTPSGALYIRVGNTSGKVMRASAVGGAWTQIATDANFTDINGKPTGIIAIGVNPLADDQIAISSGGSFHPGDWTPSEYWQASMRLSSGGVLGSKSAEFLAVGFSTGSVILYANGQWNLIATHNHNANMQLFQFNSSGAYLSMFDIGGYVGQSAMATFGRTVGTSAKMFCWDASGSASGFVTISAGNLVTQYPSATYIKPSALNDMTLAVSPTGTKLLVTNGSGANKKSSDSGVTWATGLPFSAYYTIENCRDENRWILGSGTGVYLSTDFVTANTPNVTLFDKTGNLSYISPFLDITHIRYIE
jgi:hypothetical protein